MSKIFEFNPGGSGSYIDPISGDVGVNTGGEFVRTEKGTAWRGNGVNSKIAIAETTYNVHTGTYSFEFWARDLLNISVRPILGLSTTGSYSYIRFSADKFQFETNTNGDLAQATLRDNDTLWHHYMVTCNAGTVALYQDGVSVAMSDPTILNPITFDLIGMLASAPIWYGDIGRIQIYDHVLTESERAKLLREFNQATPTTKIIQ